MTRQTAQSRYFRRPCQKATPAQQRARFYTTCTISGNAVGMRPASRAAQTQTPDADSTLSPRRHRQTSWHKLRAC
eukprot:2890517-Alexandrium_andersonii.AAC.1